MLKLKPNCECCDADLPPASTTACICSFECTFCDKCAGHNFRHSCPNCGGDLVTRPTRPAEHLAKHPASTSRYINEAHAGMPNYASGGMKK